MSSSVNRISLAWALVLDGEVSSSWGHDAEQLACESSEEPGLCLGTHPRASRRRGRCPRGGFASIQGPPRWARRAWTWAPVHLIDKPVLLCVFLSLVTDSEDDGESEAAKQLIQPIAEKIIAKYKAKEEEAPLLFFVAGEVSAAGAPRAGSAGRPLEHE